MGLTKIMQDLGRLVEGHPKQSYRLTGRRCTECGVPLAATGPDACERCLIAARNVLSDAADIIEEHAR
jgi:hypothetical protein